MIIEIEIGGRVNDFNRLVFIKMENRCKKITGIVKDGVSKTIDGLLTYANWRTVVDKSGGVSGRDKIGQMFAVRIWKPPSSTANSKKLIE